MYQVIDGVEVVSVNQWLDAGLTKNQLWKDSKDGKLEIFQRSTGLNTLIRVDSIRRPERLRVLNAVYRKAEDEKPVEPIYRVAPDEGARVFYTTHKTESGERLKDEQIEEYSNRASIFEGMRRGLLEQRQGRASCGEKLKKGDWLQQMLRFYNEQAVLLHLKGYQNERSLERAFQEYLNQGYGALIHKGLKNCNARVVGRGLENLILSLYRTHDKPFVKRVHTLLVEFIRGDREFYDTATGELYHPKEFQYKGRPMEVSEKTVWRYLKKVDNNISVYQDRNGRFDYMNTQRIKHHRKLGNYTLSKLSMDDVALSRKSTRGYLYKYKAVDVLSGYEFRPAYVVGKPTIETVVEAFRNVFAELREMGLPAPGELEVEKHLMKDIPWLEELFPFVRFCESPTEKRAEHSIRRLKYGVSKNNGHTRGRWYSKSEAYKSVRNKIKGDYEEGLIQPQTLLMDDLYDIDEHNNTLHDRQDRFQGMTRREVLIRHYNPDLQTLPEHYIYRYIGNETPTSIRNNDFVVAAGGEFELTDYASLKLLKANDREVTAYWMPLEDGSVETVYLYQDDTYIGPAENRSKYAYNEFAFERTEEDRQKMMHQNRRAAKQDKFVKDRRSELLSVGQIDPRKRRQLDEVEIKIVESEQPKGYEEDEFSFACTDYAALARESL